MLFLFSELLFFFESCRVRNLVSGVSCWSFVLLIVYVFKFKFCSVWIWFNCVSLFGVVGVSLISNDCTRGSCAISDHIFVALLVFCKLILMMQLLLFCLILVCIFFNLCTMFVGFDIDWMVVVELGFVVVLLFVDVGVRWQFVSNVMLMNVIQFGVYEK